MNAKQTIPIVAGLAPAIAAVAPPLLLIGGVVFVVWLLSDDKKKKPEILPAATERKPLPIPPDSGGNFAENRGIPASSGGKPNLTPAPSMLVAVPVPASSIPAAPKIPVAPLPAFPVAKIAPEIPLPAQKKIISREDMTKIFNGGSGLTRKSAVAALKAFGFSKTAAYKALATNGRFASWLQFAPDGIITWKT
jgi:hypothetical protein